MRPPSVNLSQMCYIIDNFEQVCFILEQSSPREWYIERYFLCILVLIRIV